MWSKKLKRRSDSRTVKVDDDGSANIGCRESDIASRSAKIGENSSDSESLDVFSARGTCSSEDLSTAVLCDKSL